MMFEVYYLCIKKVATRYLDIKSYFVIGLERTKTLQNMDKFGNNIGYLVLKIDGTIVQSGGHLENDEHSAKVIMEIINLTESVDENFISNNGCEYISLTYDDFVFNICMSNKRIYIVKLEQRRIFPRQGQTTKREYLTNIDD